MTSKHFQLLAFAAMGGLLFLAGWFSSGPSSRLDALAALAPSIEPHDLPSQTAPAPPPLVATDAAMTGNDPAALAADAKDPRTRALLAERLREWATLDGAGATDWVEANLEGGLRRASLFNVLSARGENEEGSAAADFVLSLQNDPVFDVAMQGLVHGWSKSNPAAAGEWLAGEAPKGDEADNAAGQLARSWAEADPGAAAAWAVDYFARNGSGLAFQRAIGVWAIEDISSASAFVKNAPPDLQFQGYMQIGMAWASIDAPAAAAWANGLESSRIRHGALGNIVETWSRQAPSEAAAFVSAMTSGEAQATAARFLVGNWVETDMVAASAWLGTLSHGIVRDEAVSELGNRLLDSDPESALTWSLSIDNTALREGQIEDLLHSWLLRDEPKARAWLETHDIPLELLATMEDRIPGGG